MFIKANISVVFGRELDDRKREILGRESCEYLIMNMLDFLKLNKVVNPGSYHEFIEIIGSSPFFAFICFGVSCAVFMRQEIRPL